jgi:hypothetical protein
LGQRWDAQRSTPANIVSVATTLGSLLEKPEEERTAVDLQQIRDYDSNLRQIIGAYASGQLISTSHPHFGLIQAIADTDPNAAAALQVSCFPDGHSLLGQSQALDAMARIGAAAASLDTSRKKTIRALREELATLKKNAEADIASWRDIVDEHKGATNANVLEHQAAVKARNEEVQALFKTFGEEWEELKRVYDEKLALLAPTEYWRTRATTHKEKARNYAIAFGVTIAVALALFSFLAIGHLANPGTGSVVLVLLPVIVPAFAAIWVLRMLGRMLSENLAISQDAAERETMVKTFLALMRDETTGKSVVTDEDRRLILQALFRPSSVTATDDSPPVHWFEALRGR